MFSRSPLLLMLGVVCLPVSSNLPAEAPNVLGGKPSEDRRLADLQNLNGYFPFRPVENIDQWTERQQQIKRRILVSQGLWPLPTKTPLNAVIHGRVERDDYIVDRVYFESIPGHFVTGSLYRPKSVSGKVPAILSPHGHWNNGRFYDAGEATVRAQIESGAEKFEISGRYPIQARAVQLARMGCLVFVYDMTGYADAIQIGHRPASWSALDGRQDWGFMSVQADLRLQNMMGLQTWNSIRAVDFMQQLDEVDATRIGVTGASGGGTQSMILAAIDSRVAAAMPCVMVSTSMQGGCTCENAPLLRIDQGNIEIAAATAPRPLGLTAADDWTIELKTKGYPDLRNIYELVGHPERLTAVFHTQFKHNYNAVNRAAMYSFFNRHFELGLEEPIVERDFTPLTRDEASVWTETHPAPSGDAVGAAHEVKLLKMATNDNRQRMQRMVPESANQIDAFQNVVGGGWATVLGRTLDEVGEVEFRELMQSQIAGGVVLRGGILDHPSAGEQLPAFRIDPKGPAKGAVVWITDSGKASLFDGDNLDDAVRDVVDRGWTVLGVDLFQQGEFLPADAADLPATQRMWYQGDGKAGWHRFSGYTFGYNHCLFSRRVHDVLTSIQYAGTLSNHVRVVGLGDHAGLWAAGASSQCGDALDEVVVELGGFRFDGVTKHDDPMFVPGAVKYLDVDGLVALVAPQKVTVIGQTKLPVTETLYEAYSAKQAWRSVDDFQSVTKQW